MRLITVPMEGTKTATVLVLVGAGSRYEDKKINGISHFLEHMIFKGTKKRPNTLAIAKEMDSIGAEYNAFTSKEYTGYYAKCASDKINTAIDVVSDIFQNSLFDGEEIGKEKGTIKEEINMHHDNPAWHVSEIYEATMFGNHPLGWDVAGEKEIIDGLERQNFVDYFNTHYFTQNTIVVLAGDINPEAAARKISDCFLKARQGKMIKPMPFSPTQKKPAMKIFSKKTDQTHMVIGFRAYHRLHPKMDALQLLSVILGGSMSSRLFMEVRERRGLAYAVRTSADGLDETGDFSTYAGVTNDKVATAIEVILDEHKKIIKDSVPEEELKKAKDCTKGRFVIGLESSDEVASYYGGQLLLEKRILTPSERMERIDKVTVRDIQEVAKDVFTADKLNLAIVGSFKENDEGIAKAFNSF
ncbi:MAG: hypothetical protein CEN90_673 [Parcubacteria group bacterium Licking1014_17]|nr:MAG: hypothetical protein CEN90_673 [Parcubacteria group bacterium Licking1014_17]